ncbi:Na+/H+ antiporter NhaA [Candidatus Berkiella cookevillensis]|uniref:Na(+)/H(+) antiporter NhaA n=1 Tax=Candidatus Berkiella cookevillensis TaxID=437022 RepID=A0A0Q9YAK3_9GAMM|nr:Na+/H+ antiporter NhaA [Candidatus Berkiella cookevillensis]MCS5709508.1 Na+/H+ antiporter NhaA [Candidatus Berkiella cookevillensis]
MLGYLQNFFKWEAAGGVLLAFATVIALCIANSPFSEAYVQFFQLPVIVKIGEFGLDKTLLLWINDGLMAVFFLLVGLELKREWLEGELSNAKSRVLPGIAALFGMIVPALFYVFFTQDDPTRMRGWAIPAATDIAFALGVLSLFGSRIPIGLKIFLVTLAIIDDVGAILIIAIFYTSQLSLIALGLSGVLVFALYLLNRKNVYAILPYILLGSVLWFCVLKSGVHATIAGVLLAFCIPLQSVSQSISPLKKLEHELHPYVVFFILPLFAFANAGVSINTQSLASLDTVSQGVASGLLLGKPIGVLLGTWLGMVLFKAKLPNGVNLRLLLGMAFLCGIGFTMSLFISFLAFDVNHLQLAAESRLAILLASATAACIGALFIYWETRSRGT